MPRTLPCELSELSELMVLPLRDFFPALLGTIGLFLGLCALQILRARRATPARPREKPPQEFAVDLMYWLTVSTFRVASRLTALALIVLAALALGRAISPRLLEGHGPVLAQPRWLLLVELFVLTDFISYWSHRACHRVPLLWRFHKIHHSPRTVRWTSTARLHPVNEVFTYTMNVLPAMALGFPFEALAPLAPLVSLFAIWSHSKSNASLGPLKRVLTGPLFHRWHHTHTGEGGDANFGGIFSFWDVLFRTHYLPEGRVPERFGLDGEVLEESFWAQLAHPFRRRVTKASATNAEQVHEAHRDHGRQSRDRLCAGEAVS